MPDSKWNEFIEQLDGKTDAKDLTCEDIGCMLKIMFDPTAQANAKNHLEYYAKHPDYYPASNPNSNSNPSEKSEYDRCYKDMIVEFTNCVCGEETPDEIVTRCTQRLHTLLQTITFHDLAGKIKEFTHKLEKDLDVMDKYMEDSDEDDKKIEAILNRCKEEEEEQNQKLTHAEKEIFIKNEVDKFMQLAEERADTETAKYQQGQTVFNKIIEDKRRTLQELQIFFNSKEKYETVEKIKEFVDTYKERRKMMDEIKNFFDTIPEKDQPINHTDKIYYLTSLQNIITEKLDELKLINDREKFMFMYQVIKHLHLNFDKLLKKTHSENALADKKYIEYIHARDNIKHEIDRMYYDVFCKL